MPSFFWMSSNTSTTKRRCSETLRMHSPPCSTGQDSRLRQILWWGYFMVPLLLAQRRRTKSRLGDPPHVIYSRYLKLPPWPVPWLMRTAMACEHTRTLKGRNRTGTSLIALAARSG
jgi:hypothetical protein